MGSNPLRNAWYGDSEGHSRAARKGWRRRKRRASSSTTRRRRRRGTRTTTTRRRRRTVSRSRVTKRTVRRRRTRTTSRSRRRRRRMRRNPVLSLGLGRIAGVNIRNLLPLAFTGGASVVATTIAPRVVGVVNPWAQYGVQAAVGIGGAAVINKTVGRDHGMAWAIASGAVIVADLLQKFVLSRVLPQYVSGIDAFPDEVVEGIAAFPDEVEEVEGIGDAYDSSPYDVEVDY